MDWSKLLSNERLKDTKPYQDRLFSDGRNDFESDYGRVVFSPGIRRMHDKTQVFPLISDDNIHTRLTHSLEVSTIAYSLGINLCSNEEFKKKAKLQTENNLFRIIPTILKTVSLCHDIGNPPFGHYGEKVISDFFNDFLDEKEEINKKKVASLNLSTEEIEDLINFDGNAQGFRVLSSLQTLQDPYGLNLTIASLSSYLKYTKLAGEELSDSNDKIGVFQTEKEKLLKIRDITGLGTKKHPLAYLMEAADNICYLVMDIEDGYNKRYFTFDFLLKQLKKNAGISDLVQNYEENDMKIIDEMGLNVDNSKMVQFRVYLLKHLVENAINKFMDMYDDITEGKFNDELISKKNDPLPKALNNFCIDHIIKNKEVVSLEVSGETILRNLLCYFIKGLIEYKPVAEKKAKIDADKKAKRTPTEALDRKEEFIIKRGGKIEGLISRGFINAILIAQGKKEIFELSNYCIMRLVIDYISGMTDTYALNLYRKINGIKIG